MESLYKSTQAILEFLKAPFLTLHCSYYTLMTSLMILFVILLSILMTLLSTLSVIKYFICGKNYSRPLNLNLNSETLWTWQEVIYWFQCLKNSTCLVWSVSDAIDLKMDGSHILSKTVALTLSLLLKPSPRKFVPRFILWSFFFLMLLLISTNLQYGLAWDTDLTHRRLLLVAAWIC